MSVPAILRAQAQRISRHPRAVTPTVEFSSLEGRLLFSANPLSDPTSSYLEYDSVADINPLIVMADSSSLVSLAAASTETTSPLSAIPLLNSNLDATAQLYLDFDGDAATTWGEFDVPAIPAYDRDGDATTFSSAELVAIEEIWMRVAEKYSPFNINVTTVAPGQLQNLVALRVVIGGDGLWCGMLAGGLAYVGGFYNYAPNTVYVFPDNLANGEPKYVAEAAAHEAGHGFGLEHQSRYSSTGQLLEEYYAGNGSIAPIMGNSYDARGIWWYGTSTFASIYQDDMAAIAGFRNGFGYRTDDHGNSIASATPLQVQESLVTGSGIIEKMTDADYFTFTTGAGTVSLDIDVLAKGPTLDLKAELRRSDGTLIATADSSALGEILTAELAAGTYRLVVMSNGHYGDVGQYTITGRIVPPTALLAAPSNLTATTAGTQVTLRWTDQSDNESSFQIQRSDDGGVTWNDLMVVDANVNQYVDADLRAGGRYLYRIYAFNELAESTLSETVTAVTAPSAPAHLVARYRSRGRVLLLWKRAYGATEYVLERSADGETWSTVATPHGRRTSYTDRRLTEGQTYYYRVRARNGGGESAPSVIASLTVPIPRTPSAPSNVQLFALTQRRMRLVWQDNSTSERGFRIQWSSNGKRWYILKRVAAGRTQADVMMWRKMAYFRVSAYNRHGQSEYSEVTPTAAAVRVPEGYTSRRSSVFSNRLIQKSSVSLFQNTPHTVPELARAA